MPQVGPYPLYVLMATPPSPWPLSRQDWSLEKIRVPVRVALLSGVLSGVLTGGLGFLGAYWTAHQQGQETRAQLQRHDNETSIKDIYDTLDKMVRVQNSLNRIWVENNNAYNRTGVYQQGQNQTVQQVAFDQVNLLRVSVPVDGRLQKYVEEVCQAARDSMRATNVETARANVIRVDRTIGQAQVLATQLKAQLKTS